MVSEDTEGTFTKMIAGMGYDAEMDKKLRVEFYMRPVLNEAKSKEEKRPVYEDVEYIRIIVPGDRDSIVEQEVWDIHRARFADRYERWKRNHDNSVQGTPITALVGVTPALAQELAHFHVTTVEQLADMSDQIGQKFMGFAQLKKKAKEFLEAAKGEFGNVVKLQSELDDLRAQNEALQKQMQEFMVAQTKQQPRK